MRQFTKNAKAAGTTQSDAVLIGEADRKSVFGKLIDLRASVAERMSGWELSSNALSDPPCWSSKTRCDSLQPRRRPSVQAAEGVDHADGAGADDDDE